MIKPLISEKSLQLSESGKYSFLCSKSLSKKEIAELITKLFSVSVEKVNTHIRKGKEKRVGKIYGRRKDLTLAIVTLKKGQKIKGYEVESDNNKKVNK